MAHSARLPADFSCPHRCGIDSANGEIFTHGWMVLLSGVPRRGTQERARCSTTFRHRSPLGLGGKTHQKFAWMPGLTGVRPSILSPLIRVFRTAMRVLTHCCWCVSSLEMERFQISLGKEPFCQSPYRQGKLWFRRQYAICLERPKMPEMSTLPV